MDHLTLLLSFLTNLRSGHALAWPLRYHHFWGGGADFSTASPVPPSAFDAHGTHRWGRYGKHDQRLLVIRTQSYQDGDVAMSPPRPHFMSPRPHSEGLVHSDADGVQNWPKCVAWKLWKLNSHLAPNCNLRMWRMLFSICVYPSSGHINKNRKWMVFLGSWNFNF